MRPLLLALLLTPPGLTQAPLAASFGRGATELLRDLRQDDGDGGRELHGAFGTEVPTKYFFRGILRENKGLIVEPFLELTTTMFDHGQDTLRRVELTFGQWNSLHSGPTGTAGSDSAWFEHDFYVDVDARLEERWRGIVRYTTYYSPNANFQTVQELSVIAHFDDRELLGPMLPGGLQPHATIAFETSGQADSGRRQGAYGEVGVVPEFQLGEVAGGALTLRVPASIGFSLYRYFELPGGTDSTFGFLDVGAEFAVPLHFLPSRMGPWEGSLALHALVLGDSNRARNGGDRTDLVLTFGMSTRF